MEDMQKQIIEEQDRLWRESREQAIGSISHLALISSGSIIVSVNALVPITTLRGVPIYLDCLIAAWLLLLSATVLTIPYRASMSRYSSDLARYLDCYSGRFVGAEADRLREQTAKGQKRLKWWERAAWGCFILGIVCLLVFVAANVR